MSAQHHQRQGPKAFSAQSGAQSGAQPSEDSVTQSAAHAPSSAKDFCIGLSAFVMWGLMPLFWNLLRDIPAQEIIGHRVIWSVVFLIPVVMYTRCWPEIMTALRDPAVAMRCFLSGALVTGNWYLHVWAVNSGHVLETSLGYYINPLMNVAVGAIFFHERLNRIQCCAIALATFGVLIMVIGHGHVPWVGLGLASSFLVYGIMRKTVKVNALAGLFIETSMIAPFALVWLLWLDSQGTGSFGHVPPMQSVFLALAGLATSVPLLCFSYAARTLRLTTIGLMQYTGPTISFILGTFFFCEPITPAHLATFACIWLALILYSFDSWRTMRRLEPSAKA